MFNLGWEGLLARLGKALKTSRPAGAECLAPGAVWFGRGCTAQAEERCGLAGVGLSKKLSLSLK